MRSHNLLSLLIFVGIVVLFISSCQKAPEITITGPASIELSEDGSSGTITFTANRDWSASWTDSWVSVSPSSGSASKDPVTVTLRCGANTTYDDRTATVTIKAEDITQTITVRQPANLGVVLPSQSYELASDTRSIDVTVQANVEYSVVISDSWIKLNGTKALSSKTFSFSIEENTTYDPRSATIIIKPQNSNVSSQTISVRQAQKDALIVDKTSYDMPYGGGEIEEKVEANVSFDVTPSVDWIHHVETKALTASTVRLKVDENTTTNAREGTVVIKQRNGSLSHTVTVKQSCFIPVNSISLDVSTATIVMGDELLLKATIVPYNATDKTTSWETSDASIVTVDSEGKVKAVKKGHAFITVKAGKYSASCNIFVRSSNYPTPSGAVDLGLSVIWAEKNLGATTAAESGDYYLWGDPAGTGTIMFFSAPNTNNICDTQHDIAKAKLGKGWRLPTREEIKELFSSCTWEKTSNGVYLTGPNGKSMTIPLSGMSFPADGAMGATQLSSTDKGYLMTGESYADGYGRFAYVYYFGQDFSYNWASWNAPMAKFPVRPVFESLDGSIPVSSLSLNKTELTLKVGESETLVATIQPDDATDKNVTWNTSDSSIALVDNGIVTAVKEGTVEITAMSGEKTIVCKVKVTPLLPEGAVDLGIVMTDYTGRTYRLYWADRNIGASSPEDYGDYYAWGETETKPSYDWTTYKWCNGSNNSLTKYNTSSYYGAIDKKYLLEKVDDVAHVKLGSNWRMPTDDEWYTLRTNSNCVETTQNGVKGIKVTGPSGNSIFLPYAGQKSGTSLSEDTGSEGFYWSSFLKDDHPDQAYYIWLWGTPKTHRHGGRSAGLTIRPVFDSLDGYTHVTSIALNKTDLSLKVGESENLVATVNPNNATDKTVTWSTSDASIATVDHNGKVVAMKEGITTITAKAEEITATCTITITASQIAVSSVELNRAKMFLKEGESETLIVTVKPEYATDKTVTWSSSDVAVATVDEDGKVTALKEGNASITAKAGEKTATCSVTVRNPPAGSVDLGLSVFWATCNIGSSKPEDYGNYYAWGETNAKEFYRWSTYKWCDGTDHTFSDGSSITKYNTKDNLVKLTKEDDAATVKLGGNWRTPSIEEWQELSANCTFQYISKNGVQGLEFVSTINGNSIFLPGAGYMDGDSLCIEGRGYYWSSTRCDSPIQKAWNFNTYSPVAKDFNYRFYGYSVRPVCE